MSNLRKNIMSNLRKLHVAQNNVLQCCPTWLPGAVMIQNRQKIMSKLWVRHRMEAAKFFSRTLLMALALKS